MPYSDSSNIPWVLWALEEVIKPKTVLDVGAGAGKYGDLVRKYSSETHIDAIEVWEPYIQKFGLKEKYDDVYVADVRTFHTFAYDLVILGDVLEHMTREEAIELWARISKEAKFAIISIPIIHYPQHEHEGNPYEVHVEEDWTHEEVLSSFPGITGYRTFDITGVYIGEFK